jgi:2-methylisocitrate lyase-like PEP mutase family enzyme
MKSSDPDLVNTTQLDRILMFKRLHDAGCFLLPNPWDIGSAVFLEQLGYKALATSSAGFAFTMALPDDPAAIPLELMLSHVQSIAEATSLPVNADFQNGFADDPEGVAINVGRCIATGVAGLSIEDASGNKEHPLYEKELAVERIKAARQAIDQTDLPVVLTGRCEAWLVGDAEPFKTAVDRLIAYAEAGADCLYAPGVTTPKEIEAIVKAVAPKPVNVLMSRPNPNLSLAKLSELGVRRISVGSAFARVAWGAFMRAAKEMLATGEFDCFSEVATMAELNQVFARRSD